MHIKKYVHWNIIIFDLILYLTIDLCLRVRIRPKMYCGYIHRLSYEQDTCRVEQQIVISHSCRRNIVT